MTNLNKAEIEILVNITKDAGKIAMSYFGSKNLQINSKADDSPVTNADIEISGFIDKKLKQYFPKIEIICEEGINRKILGNKFWLVDPIDGTKSFARTSEEFTVNIGLIENNKPIFGIIYAPAMKDTPLYYTNENGQTVKLLVDKNSSEILSKKVSKKEKFIIISGSESDSKDIANYIQNNLKDNKELEVKKVSSSIKFCYIADGKADLYLHFRKSMEWDTAAGQALILGCGGKVVDMDGGRNLEYRKAGFCNHEFLVTL
jgi:3'(2'), 5'-bisphosphate nucleotidase